MKAENLSPLELRKAKVKKIIQVTIILAVVTSVEFILAFAWPETVSRLMLNILFLVLTVVKAFYIIFEFMHLGHEVKMLKWSILFPMLFIVWLIIALLVESDSIIQFSLF